MSELRKFIATTIREYLNEAKNKQNFVIKSRPGDGFNDWESKNITLFIKNDDVAWCDYKVKDGKVYIDYIETEYEGNGYGQMIIKHLADKYGYSNLERGSLTPSGRAMRDKLDKYYNYKYDYTKES